MRNVLITTKRCRKCCAIMKTRHLSAIILINLVFIVFQLTTRLEKAEAAGIFELQITNLTLPFVRQQHQHRNDLRNQDETIQQQQPSNSIKVLVCIKEAFASNLDEPCTLGNASLTLSKAEIAHLLFNKQQQTQTVQDDVNHESHLNAKTNLVKILFTFRWTKSFTIIVSIFEQQHQQQLQYHNQLMHLQRQLLQQTNINFTLASSTGSRTKNVSAQLPLQQLELQLLQPITIEQKDKTLIKKIDNQDQATVRQADDKWLLLERFVATESDILPAPAATPLASTNTTQSNSKTWTRRLTRSPKASLAYQFRVSCAQNYFGDGCTNFCRPRDDQFGHYSCSPIGNKLCFDGWTGADCSNAKCRADCNLQHAHCDHKPGSCECRQGWTGERCDECVTYPGCQNGYCLSPWQCICNRNWGGVLCNLDLNYCGTHEPCKNNGTCSNIAPGKFKCHCRQGFIGADCSVEINHSFTLLQVSSSQQQAPLLPPSPIRLCENNPCLNGGTCVEEADYNNNATTNDELLVDFLNKDYFYKCNCESGWTGDICQQSTRDITTTTPSLDLNSTVANNTETLATTNQPLTLSENQTETVSTEPIETRVEYVTPFFHSPSGQQVEFKHLISGVMLASALGVIFATLLLIWGCLVLLESNNLSMIQMRIVQRSVASSSNEDENDDDDDYNGDSDGKKAPTKQQQQPQKSKRQQQVTLTFRWMQEKIRDSFRLSSSKIKPQTKLNIDNALQPPKYTESQQPIYYQQKQQQQQQQQHTSKPRQSEENTNKASNYKVIINNNNSCHANLEAAASKFYNHHNHYQHYQHGHQQQQQSFKLQEHFQSIHP